MAISKIPKGKPTNHINLGVRRRMNFVIGAGLSLLLLYVVSFVAYHGVVIASEYQETAASQQSSTLTISANRGTIYDSNMVVLASSSTVWTVVLAPSTIAEDDQVRIAQILSQILDLDYETVYAQTQKDNQYEVVAQNVEQTAADEISKFISDNNYYSITLIEDTKRYYPQSTMAAQVIGFTNADNSGTYGIEQYYDDILSGTDGKVVTAVDANGDAIPTSYEQTYDAIDGQSLVLTLDSGVQQILENVLDSAMEVQQPKNGATAIAMDVNTGEILGIANSTEFDLNDPYTIIDSQLLAELENPTEWGVDEYGYSAYVDAEIEDMAAYETELMYSQWQNMAVMTQYNPGSVFKVVTGTAALEEGVISANSEYYCTGTIEVADAIYSCNVTYGHGQLYSFSEMLSNSCNPAFITMGLALGISTFNQYVTAYGFGEQTGIDLPAEATGSIYATEDMSIVDLASESFGQSLAVSPIQMITAVAAATNGGYLVEPYVVSDILDENGSVVSTTQTNVKRQVISESTSELLLEGMVAMAEAAGVTVSGYSIAAKSGTSQVNNEQGSGRYVASMVAVAPADDPQIAILVVVNEPTSGDIYGSQICGPIVRDMLSEILPYLGIEESYDTTSESSTTTQVPTLSGYSIEDATEAIYDAELYYEIIGDGDTIQQQVPSGGSYVENYSTVILYTDTSDVTQTEVPDVVGMSVSNATYTLEAAGFNVVASGSDSTSGALVDNQSLAAGTMQDEGSIITITYSTTVVDG